MKWSSQTNLKCQSPTGRTTIEEDIVRKNVSLKVSGDMQIASCNLYKRHANNNSSKARAIEAKR